MAATGLIPAGATSAVTVRPRFEKVETGRALKPSAVARSSVFGVALTARTSGVARLGSAIGSGVPAVAAAFADCGVTAGFLLSVDFVSVVHLL